MLKDETRKKVLKKALVDKICPNKAKKKKKDYQYLFKVLNNILLLITNTLPILSKNMTKQDKATLNNVNNLIAMAY